MKYNVEITNKYLVEQDIVATTIKMNKKIKDILEFFSVKSITREFIYNPTTKKNRYGVKNIIADTISDTTYKLFDCEYIDNADTINYNLYAQSFAEADNVASIIGRDLAKIVKMYFECKQLRIKKYTLNIVELKDVVETQNKNIDMITGEETCNDE